VRQATRLDEARTSLIENYQELVTAVVESRHADLRHAWDEFEESLVDPSAAPLSSTVHANEFFEPLVEQSRGLFWWANIMVAIGLLFTFLGIMAALGNTAVAMEAAGDAANMQRALQDLLKVTAAKFMTSFFGIGASIALRSGDHRLQGRIRREVALLVDALERGLVYLPPQRIAAKQLRQLEQIAEAQTVFAQDLAAAIGEKLNEQFDPVVSVLGKIDSGIRNLKDELVGGVGGAVANTLNETAGREMQALAAALSAMSERLGNIPEQIGASADEAHARIENAALMFSQASGGMQAAFDELGRRIQQMGAELVEQQKAAALELQRSLAREREEVGAAGERSRAEVEAATEELRSLVSSMGGTLSDLGSKLAAQAEQDILRSEQLLARTREALGDAAASASQRFVDAAADAARAASDATSKAVEDALRQLSERIDTASRALASSIEAGATKVQAFGGSIERASASADAQAAKLASAGTAAERVAGMLDSTARETIPLLTKAGDSLGKIANPFEKAAVAIERGVEGVRTALEAQGAQLSTQVSALREMAAQFERTANAAQAAWQSYSERFGQVDESLGNVLRGMEAASRERAEMMVEYANKLDTQLASAVAKLAAAIDELADIAESLVQGKK
ncbi:MAG: hypothetical protein ACK4TG_03640, partial [Thermaurantiacus sp.]